MPEPKGNSKKITIITIISVVVVIVFVFIGMIVGRMVVTNLMGNKAPTTPGSQSAAESTKAKRIEAIVSEAKSQVALPKMVDDITRWDDIRPGADAVLYDYTLVSGATNDTDRASINQHLVQTLCSTPSTRAILDSDIKMSYRYDVQSDGGAYVYVISKNDCAAS